MPDTPFDLASALRGLGAADPESPEVRIARAAWDQAAPFTRSAALLLLAPESVVVAGEKLAATPLPRSLALPLLSSLVDWAGADPGAVESLAAKLRERLSSAGYRVEDMDTLSLVAAAWLDSPGEHSMVVLARQAARVASLEAGNSSEAARLLARGLALAAERRALREVHGLILPAEAKAAIDGLTLARAAEAAGTFTGDLSKAVRGLKRLPDHAALWLHRRLEESALVPA